MVIVEFKSSPPGGPTGSSRVMNNSHLIQTTCLPGSTITVVRRSRKVVEAEFQMYQRIATMLESLNLLSAPVQARKSDSREKTVELAFAVGAEVECDYEDKGEFWPCRVIRVNDNKTYDLDYEKEYKWVGTQRGVDPDLVEKRGLQEKKKKGENLWRWEGMSDSDDDDWRDDDRASDDEDEHLAAQKKNISFAYFDNIGVLLRASSGDEDACLKALGRVSRQAGVKSFTDIHALADAVSQEVAAGQDVARTLISLSRGLDPASDKDQTAAVTASNSLVDSGDLVLLNLLYAPRRSRLHSILKVLSRIETAGQICAWTRLSSGEVCCVHMSMKQFTYLTICLSPIYPQ